MTYWGSGVLGMLPMALLKSKNNNANSVRLIGFMGGIGWGLYLALPAMSLCLLLSYMLEKVSSRNYLGSIVFVTISFSSLFIL